LRTGAGHDSPLIGESAPMLALKEQIGRLAPIPSPVLILGESGAGKELVARQLHDASGRSGGVFVAVNCAALPENLTESELFGHERGAFTGADRTRRGAFENAAHGTLFLDEVGELPPAAQAKLLRVLEAEAITRVGGTRPVAVDARVVAATNRDLEAAVARGDFREDLLFRLNVHVLPVPPLRERLDDIPLLADHLLAATCAKFGVRPRRFSPAALARLADYDWARNNVRELRNVVERAVIASDDEVIPSDAVTTTPGGRTDAALPAGQSAGAADVAPVTFKAAKAAAERRIVLDALERNDWRLTDTAAELGLADHSSLSKIMRRHGLRK
jgi:transcriptional regulator with GAF, ATPase, and Fis domain